MSLTNTALRNAKPGEKPYKLYAEKGLFIQITPKGGKWWRFKYRYAGKEKLISLGTYPDVSLLDARERRDEARKLLSQVPPVDPSEVKKAQKDSINGKHENTFEILANEWLESYFVNKTAPHKARTLRRLSLHAFPLLGKKAISEITPPEILQTIKRPQLLGKLETAHRTLQAIGQVFRYAVQHGKAERDVTADIKGALPSTNVKHMPAITEPSEVAGLLRAIDAFKGTFTVECALKVAPLVFTRPSELRGARWEDIDLEGAEWRYRVSKTNTDHIVPLPTQVISIFRELYKISGHGEFVFRGGRDPKKPMSEAAINAALRRMGYDTKTQMTGHGFRAMARTILHERLNIDPHIIEHQLAHSVPDALGTAYNRTKFLTQRKEMMQQWADYLDDLKAGS